MNGKEEVEEISNRGDCSERTGGGEGMVEGKVERMEDPWYGKVVLCPRVQACVCNCVERTVANSDPMTSHHG